MTAPQEVLDLIERFERDRDVYRSSTYNETQLRREFLDPFFKALGWDVDNTAGHAPAYRDVIHEDLIKVAGKDGGPKAPDYCFRIGGTRKFFVEAKRPSVDVKGDIGPAFQLRRYAWSNKLPLSILTDFEELAVYDCRVKPVKTDKSSVARTMYLTFDQYAEKWDEIVDVFSREAVLRGSFDRYAETAKAKRGTAEVDVAFLKEIESWRETLARNFALRNGSLTTRELNHAVQTTIDRIVFLRICEDRGIEDYGRLVAQTNGANVYALLLELFQEADEKYNSGLFHFRNETGQAEAPDELTPSLRLDDKVLRDIIKSLYYPDSPYEFSVLPSDILGQVYEQFLGKVIRLTAGHQAKVEDKPEVKKAGGVYYTPTYIVDYIVENTVGKLVEGKKLAQVAKLRILDPACGSGSFLIGAYQYLLDWHRQYYVEHDRARNAKKGLIYEASGGDWRLSTREKKRILTSNIHGVDIDLQAVEVTKLSLLLKVLEGETQLGLFRERALPDLGNNIKCGNSLIGTDFYETGQMSLLGDEERERVNPFDWETGFSEIMKVGGFDAVIGNPPYIRVRTYRELRSQAEVEYLQRHYECAVHVWDVYLLMFERAVQLLKRGGLGSFIVPIQTLHQPNCLSLRDLLLRETSLKAVVDLSALKVFEKAIVKNAILVAETQRKEPRLIAFLRPHSIPELHGEALTVADQRLAIANPGRSLKVDLFTEKRAICDKMRQQGRQLAEMCYVTFGLRSCARGRGQGGKDRLITDNGRLPEARPYLEGRDIGRYEMHPTGRFIRYLPGEMYSPRTAELFEAEKIVAQSMLSRMRLVATLDAEGYYVEQSLVCIVPHGLLTPASSGPSPSLEYILGVLNSRAASFYYATWIIDYSLGGGLIHATPGSIETISVPEAGPAEHERLVELVNRMLELHKQLAAAKTSHEKDVIQRQIGATDREIDALVYDLYGLTNDEIKIVEEATAK